MRTIRTTLCIGILSLLLLVPLAAFGGAVQDTDGDLVPNQFDNCSTAANGPNQTTNQVDCDRDGYGNRCDTDTDQSCTTTTADFGGFLALFGTSVGFGSCSVYDFDGSATITTADFGIFLGKFSNPPGAPGPSGLACADCRIRIGLGDPPCNP